MGWDGMAAVMLTGGLLGSRTPFLQLLPTVYVLHTWAVEEKTVAVPPQWEMGGTLGIPLYVNTHYRTVSTLPFVYDSGPVTVCTTQHSTGPSNSYLISMSV